MGYLASLLGTAQKVARIEDQVMKREYGEKIAGELKFCSKMMKRAGKFVPDTTELAVKAIYEYVNIYF